MIKNLKTLLREELLEYLDTEFNQEYNCTVKEAEFSDRQDLKCVFKTNLGNNYEVIFFTLKEPKTILINGKSIIEISKTISDDRNFGYTVAPSFTIEGTNKNTADDSTYKNETTEVIGRTISIVKQFIKNNPKYNIFTVGKHTEKRRLNTYLYLFKNQFKDMFDIVEGKSTNANGKDAYYFIRK